MKIKNNIIGGKYITMSSIERRKLIEDMIKNSRTPLKGQNMAEKLGVTRQVIVKDIAILRAEGKNIIATPNGYFMPFVQKSGVKRVIAVSHNEKEIEDELNIIVKFGGTVDDVIVEHPIYGEIKGNLMIRNLYDIQKFTSKLNNNLQPLLILTDGIHLHTIEAEDDQHLELILSELKKAGFLINSEE
ncbi:MAG: hypothetical protein K0R54_4220 [Clostridiaceae bacterium]|nr:hypothetical protein [Clostridiaceae bacterium]